MRSRLAVVLALVVLAAAGCSPTPSASTSPFPLPTSQPEPSPPVASSSPAASPSPASALVPGRVDRATIRTTATYDADVTLGVRSGALTVSETILAKNDDTEPIDRVELNTTVVPLAVLERVDVKVDGTAVDASLNGQTIIVPLGGVLNPGQTVRLTVDYAATIRSLVDGDHWLLARGAGVVELYRWLPWVSELKRWRHPAGDPFVTPTSPEVRVRLHTDRPVFVGASATAAGSPDKAATDFTFEAVNVRDFNLILSEAYAVSTSKVGDTDVLVLVRPGGLPAKTIQAFAKQALTTYETSLGPYPWPALTIAESASGYGMESPALVWLPTSRIKGLDYLVPHEIAHQWFYGLVGNDQVDDPFADEAIADFMARDLIHTIRASRCPFERADRSIYEYSPRCYYESVYVQGSKMYDAVRDAMGNATFWAALRGYVEAHAFGFGSTRELVKALDDATKVNLRPFFAKLLPSRL